MVYESRVGDVFALGATSWRIEDITHDRVVVSPAFGQPGPGLFDRNGQHCPRIERRRGHVEVGIDSAGVGSDVAATFGFKIGRSTR